MSIRTKLLISYIAMLIIPIILMAFVLPIMGIVFTGNMNFMKFNPMKNVMDETSKVLEDIQQTSLNNTELLLDEGYLHTLDEELLKVNTGILVRRENDIVYFPSIYKGNDIAKNLPEFNIHGIKNESAIKLIGGNPYGIKQFDFYYDKTKCSVFLIADISPFGMVAKRFIIALMISIFLILIFTNGVLTYIVSKNITKPIYILMEATSQIMKGNLNFKVSSSSKDEIGKLSNSFDDMRLKLKESYEKQVQYENSRKELISCISHDLKTPITAIRGYIEVIMDGLADNPEKLNNFLKSMYIKTGDMDKMVDDLFLFSKYNLGKVPFCFKKVKLKKLIKQCIDEQIFDIESKRILVKLLPETDEEFEVFADREKLKRVFLNIINNCVKYMDKLEGTIVITLLNKGKEVCVTIEDNGKGIKKDDLPFVFESFYRAEQSRNTSTGGSGLGLAIAKQIIDGHSGIISVESEYGINTKVIILLSSEIGGETIENEKNIDN